MQHYGLTDEAVLAGRSAQGRKATNPLQAELAQMTGRASVPVVFVCGLPVGGEYARWSLPTLATRAPTMAHMATCRLTDSVRGLNATSTRTQHHLKYLPPHYTLGLNSDDGADSHLDAGLRKLLEAGSIAAEISRCQSQGGWSAERWSSGERLEF